MPYLAAVHCRTGHTALLGVLRTFDVAVLEKIGRPGDPPGQVAAGTRAPASCTALGKAMLAYEHPGNLATLLPDPLPAMRPRSITDVSQLMAQLRAIRRGALARSHDEAWPGIACIASPIVVNGTAVGAISVAHPLDAQLSPGTAAVLRETTARLTAEILTGQTTSAP